MSSAHPLGFSEIDVLIVQEHMADGGSDAENHEVLADTPAKEKKEKKVGLSTCLVLIPAFGYPSLAS